MIKDLEGYRVHQAINACIHIAESFTQKQANKLGIEDARWTGSQIKKDLAKVKAKHCGNVNID